MWGIVEYGYEPKTTFWEDFSIADKFGIKAVKDTYNRAFEDWKEDYIYLTELAMVLNWKGWEHQDKQEWCQLYTKLWQKTDRYACSHLKGEQLSYYFKTTD